LANENSIYARENRFLREIVEYHQLTMQDVVYIDEGIEEVTEVYPISIPRMLSISPPPSPTSPRLPSEISPSVSPPEMKEIFPVPMPPQENKDVVESEVPQSLSSSVAEEEDTKRPILSS
jgi:hypothetical protein